jgi:hypothetical protein
MNGTTASNPPQMRKLLVGVVGVEVADQPTVTPRLFKVPPCINGTLELTGPPKVPMSMSW